MSNHTFLLTGRSNVLECTLRPPLELNGPHAIGLIDFVAYNSIPNVDESMNQLVCSDSVNGDRQSITIPIGAYEIDNLQEYLQDRLGGPGHFSMKANNSTLKVSIKCSRWIHFQMPGTIGPLLGFGSRCLPPNEWHEADKRVDISSVNTICVECNVAEGSYMNGESGHVIFTFAPDVEPGFKMVLRPPIVVYYAVTKNVIDRLRVNIVDQRGRPINFGGEEVTVHLHMKPLTNG